MSLAFYPLRSSRTPADAQRLDVRIPLVLNASLWSFLLGGCLCTLAGCSAGSGLDGAQGGRNQQLVATTDAPSSIPSALTVPEFDFDFGPIVYRAGLELSHTFQIRNDSAALVQLRLGNWSRCCLTPELDRDSLEPGESAELRATLRVNRHAGFLAGSCNVNTGLQDKQQTLRLTVSVTVYPSSRLVTPEGNVPPPLRLRPGETAKLSLLLLAFAAGLDDNPELRSSSADLRIGNIGPATRQVVKPGVPERIWPVELILSAGDALGQCQANIEILGAEGVLARQAFSWYVEPVLRARPGCVIVRHGQEVQMTTAVVIRSLDGVPFRVLKVTGTEASVRGTANGSDAQAEHSVEITVERVGSDQPRTAALIIETDRSDQHALRLPVLFLDATAEATGGQS